MRLLRQLDQAHLPELELYIISPFRMVIQRGASGRRQVSLNILSERSEAP